MPPMPLEADALPDLVTPLTARRRGFRLAGAALEFAGGRDIAIEQIEIGELARQQRGIGEADIFVVGRDAGHRDRPLGELGNAVAGNIIGRDHRLALSDQYAQSDIVAFGALGFLDPAIAHLDALRDAAHRNRVGGVRAGALGGLDQPLRQRRERRLVEQVGSMVGDGPSKAAKWWMVKSSQTKSLTLKRAGTQIGKTHQMCLIHRDFKHFAHPNAKQFRHLRKVSSIMCAKVLSIMRVDPGRVTSP